MSNSSNKTVLIVVAAVVLALVALIGVVVAVGVLVFFVRVSRPDDAPVAVRPTPMAEAPDVAAPIARDPKWAKAIEKPGLPNLHKVSDRLYRGAQPTAEGMEQLKAMGVRTVVNLRKFHSDRDEIGDTGLAYEHIYFNPLHPEDKEVVRFLQIATDKTRTPAFVHCQHGADRTGTVCALYRIIVQGWSRDEAIREMTDGPFGHHEAVFGNLRHYIRELDIEAIKKRAGLVGKTERAPTPAPDAPPRRQ